MMGGTKRNGELIADLQTQPLGLRVAYVMRVRGDASADEARLASDKAQMLSLQRTRFGSLMVSTLLSTLGRAAAGDVRTGVVCRRFEQSARLLG
jgi:hypothetical protein